MLKRSQSARRFFTNLWNLLSLLVISAFILQLAMYVLTACSYGNYLVALLALLLAGFYVAKTVQYYLDWRGSWTTRA